MTRIAVWAGLGEQAESLWQAWERRNDCFVAIEPLVAHYLVETGRTHPRRRELLETREHDWRRVVLWLAGPIPQQRTVFYQHQPAEHLVASVDLAWLDGQINCLLIHEPSTLLLRLYRQGQAVSLQETGLVQQKRVFDWVLRRTGRPPVVIDEADLRSDPEFWLTRFCQVVGLEYTPEMVQEWNDRASDSDIEDDSLAGADLPRSLQGVLWQCEEIYRELSRYKIGK